MELHARIEELESGGERGDSSRAAIIAKERQAADAAQLEAERVEHATAAAKMQQRIDALEASVACMVASGMTAVAPTLEMKTSFLRPGAPGKIKGIGRWSAEIYLLFAEGRTDIWPAGDLAIQIEVGRILGHAERPSEKLIRDLAEAWRPHRGAAAIFAWHHYKSDMPL